jgi:hypothetical protein
MTLMLTGSSYDDTPAFQSGTQLKNPTLNASESLMTLPWKKFRRDLFRLKKRVYKAILAGDKRKTKSLQKLILKSTAARLLAIPQVSQLNTRKKTTLPKCS